MCAHDGRPQPHRTGCSREGARARSVTTVVGDRNAWVRVRKIVRANARLRVAVDAHEGAKTRSTGRNVRQRRIFQRLFPGSGKPMIGIFVVRRKCVKGKNELGMFDIARRKKPRNPENFVRRRVTCASQLTASSDSCSTRERNCLTTVTSCQNVGDDLSRRHARRHRGDGWICRL